MKRKMHHNNRINHYDGTLNKTHIILFIFLSLATLRGRSNLFFGTPKETISHYFSTSTRVDAFIVGTSGNFSRGRKRGECNPALPRKYPERLLLPDKSYLAPSFSCLHVASTSTSTSCTPCEQAAKTARTNRKSNNGSLHDSKKFQSIRESSIIVEWEPVTELERRVNEGIFYQKHQQLLVQERHFSSNRGVEEEGECSFCDHDAEHQCDIDDYCTCSCAGSWKRGRDSNGRNVETTNCPNDIPRVVGVFCGYTSTKEEKSRLKSAHPKEKNCSAIDDHDMWMI